MRCRLALAPCWRRWEAYGCSPFKRARELGSNRLIWRLSRVIENEKVDSYRWSPNIQLRFNLSYDRIIPREVAFFMNKLTKLNASYIAGFLDGDGSIYVRLKPNETYRFGFQVAPNIVFYQSKKETKFLKRLEKMIGGGYIRFRNDGIAEYIIGDTKTMRDLIKRIKPYLVLKKAQANLLIQILNQKEKVRTKRISLN